MYDNAMDTAPRMALMVAQNYLVRFYLGVLYVFPES